MAVHLVRPMELFLSISNSGVTLYMAKIVVFQVRHTTLLGNLLLFLIVFTLLCSSFCVTSEKIMYLCR